MTRIGICILVLSGMCSLQAQAEPPSYAELRANYTRHISNLFPFRIDCTLVTEALNTEAETARLKARLEETRRFHASLTAKTPMDWSAKAALREDIESLEFSLKYLFKKSEFSYTFLTDGESAQLRWQNSDCAEVFHPRASPSVGNLKELYADILVFSYSPHADKPQHRLWCGLSNGKPGGLASTTPFLYGPCKFLPVGHLDSRWGEQDRFSVMDQIMVLTEPEQVTVRRDDRDEQTVVVETILSETSRPTEADGQSGVLKDQEFLRAFISPESAPWPKLIERGTRRFFNDRLLNAPYPQIKETTEIRTFQTVQGGVYPETIVTTHFEYHPDGTVMPKFSHYVQGGTFKIPSETVQTETFHMTLRDVTETDPGIDYALTFPMGTDYHDHQLGITLIEGMTEEQRLATLEQARIKQAEKAESLQAAQSTLVSTSLKTSVKVHDGSSALLFANLLAIAFSESVHH